MYTYTYMQGIRRTYTELDTASWRHYLVTDMRIRCFLDSQPTSLAVNKGYDHYAISPELYTLVCLLAS